MRDMPAHVWLTQLAAIHLQWFATAEEEGRTEDPTEHKIRKAREEGKVAKSQELNAALILLFTVVAIGLLARFMLFGMMEATVYFFRNAALLDITTDGTIGTIFLRYFVRLALPITMSGLLAAIMSNFMQVGPLFTVKPIVPDINRIAPKIGRFLQRAFLSTESAFNLLKSAGKLAVIGLLTFLNIRARFGQFAAMPRGSITQSGLLIANTAFSILLQAAIAMLLLSIFDYLYQRRRHHESLKMTRQELKEERKTYEGDPLVHSRLRQRMRDLLSGNMAKNVPNADVVITNPIHYAVALEYRREIMEAPTIVAKGSDAIALRVREIAELHGVPLIENRPLARALYTEVEIGDIIPEKFYAAVVIIFKQIYQMKGAGTIA